ncbi:MAG: DNA replication complex subunit Gins51 [Promethearchaeota archaeon]
MKYIIEILLNTWRNERVSEDLTKLNPGICQEVENFVKSLEKMKKQLKNNNSIEEKIIDKEIQMIRYVYLDLLKIRRQKIENGVASRSRINLEYLLDFEKAFMKDLAQAHERYSLTTSIIKVKVEKERGNMNLEGYSLVNFIENHPSIMGVDLKVHGPFKEKDIAFLPRENADILVQSRVAKIIKL